MNTRFVYLAALFLVPAGTAVSEDRPFLFACGMIWAESVGRPWSYDSDSMDRIVEMGATMTSVSFDWCAVEPSPGVWDFEYQDHMVEEAVAHGLVPRGYVGNCPQWALAPDVPLGHGYRHPPDEAKLAEFQNYCRTVAARYAGRCDRFSFWNEPNGCSWINDGCRNADSYPLYTKWLKRAYVALKEGNPDCVVLAGNLDCQGDIDPYGYLCGMYRNGAKGHFDAFGIHPYQKMGQNLNWRAIERARQAMVEHGDGHLPIWITEYGWDDSSSPFAPSALVSVLNRLKSPDYDYVEVANYLVITDLPGTTSYGLCDRELNPRPVWEAYRNLDKTFPSPTPTPGGAAAVSVY